MTRATSHCPELSRELACLEQRFDLYQRFLSGIPLKQQTSRLRRDWMRETGVIRSFKRCFAGCQTAEGINWLMLALAEAISECTLADKESILDEVATYDA